MNSHKKLIIFSLFSLAIVGAIFLLTKREEKPVENSQTFDPSTFTSKYSDGWHEYSFNYPTDATITNSIGGLNREVYGEEGEIPNNAITIMTGSPNDRYRRSCTLEVSTLDRLGGDYGSLDESSPRVKLGGKQWKKVKSTSNEGSVLYEFKGVAWQIEKDNLRYVFGAHQDNEDWCEAIISTFQFGVDSSVEAAQKAKMAKYVAMQYAASRYPSKVFVEGHFLYNTTGEKRLSVLDYTDLVRVAISEPTKTNFQNSVGIRLTEQNGQWVVTGEVDPW